MAENWQDSGIWNPDTGGYSAYPEWGGGDSASSNFSWLGDLAKSVVPSLANTWSQNLLMQQNLEGQKFIEGQRLAAAQRQYSVAGVGMNGNTLLLIGAGIVVFMLVKD